MLRIGDTIFSLDIIEKKFKCNLLQCKGSCCRYGDAGAPLTSDEAEFLNKIYPVIASYLRPEGIEAIDLKGTSVADYDGELVTPLIGNEECAYTIIKNGIFMCAFEKAWADRKINFRKPLSCHLFPVRIKQYPGFRAVNYHEQDICRPAREEGSKEGLYVYEFLKEPLKRALGADLYEELCVAARELGKRNGGKRKI